MQITLPLTIGDVLESPDTSTESSEEAPSTTEDLETVSDETTSEEVSELLSEELASEDIEAVTELVYESAYAREDLQNIESSLQIIACLLFVIIIYIVVKISRSILDILGF